MKIKSKMFRKQRNLTTLISNLEYDMLTVALGVNR